MVDNCYGEFVEREEPTMVGADLIIGSLIKNPGGGMAESGGYFAGSEKAVELVSYRLTSPGVGGEVGATLGQNKSLYKGLFYKVVRLGKGALIRVSQSLYYLLGVVVYAP